MSNSIGRAYLILYNLGLTLGWSYVMYLAILDRNNLTTIYGTVRLPLILFQTAAILEVVHAAVGLVKSNPVLTLFQVSSRVFAIWGVLEISPPSQVCVGVPTLLVAWTVTEIIRYGYYFLNLIGLASIIQWFRYTLFIVLYPIGITGELLCIYYALDHVKRSNLWSISMPNAFNIAFSYQYFLMVVMFSYIPIFPMLYSHMFAQRRKILGGGSVKKSQ